MAVWHWNTIQTLIHAGFTWPEIIRYYEQKAKGEGK